MIVNPDETLIAEKHFDDSVNYRLRQHRGRAFRAAVIDALPHARAFHLWVRNSLREIMRYGFGGDRRFSSSLGAWRAVLDADFILVSLFSENRNFFGYGCGEVAVGGLFGWASPGSAPDSQPQAVIACVIHLETSHIVWCERHVLMDDLSVRLAAQADVDSLLNKMLVAGDGAALEAPPTGPSLVRATPVDDPGPVVDKDKPKLHAP